MNPVASGDDPLRDALVGGGNAILLLMAIVAFGFAVILGFLAWRNNKAAAVRGLASSLGIAIGVYLASLLIFSAQSRERILSQGQVKWFCGFYLDCHLGISVARSEDLPATSTGAGAGGLVRVVTLQLHNSAKNPSLDMTLYEPNFQLVNANGQVFQRSPRAEKIAAEDSRSPRLLGVETRVSHEPLFVTIAFEIPSNAGLTRLRVTEGWAVDRAIELVLLNDENSLFHRETFLAVNQDLPTSNTRTGSPARTDPRARLASR